MGAATEEFDAFCLYQQSLLPAPGSTGTSRLFRASRGGTKVWDPAQRSPSLEPVPTWCDLGIALVHSDLMDLLPVTQRFGSGALSSGPSLIMANYYQLFY